MEGDKFTRFGGWLANRAEKNLWHPEPGDRCSPVQQMEYSGPTAVLPLMTLHFLNYLKRIPGRVLL